MRRAWGKLALAAAVAALFAGRWIAEFTADRLWAETLGVGASHTDIAFLRLALSVGAFSIATAWYLGNLLLLYRQIGAVQVPRQVGNLEIVEHVPRRYLLIGVVGVGIGLGLLTSLGADDLWTARALYGASVPTGMTDPILERDLAYYLFELPWHRALQGYALWMAGVGLALLGLLYAAIGAVRREERRLVFLPFARWHLAALSGTLALALAWGYALEPAELAAGLQGVPYDTILRDIRIPSAVVLTLLATATAAVSLLWMRLDRARLPAVAWATLLASTFLVHFVVPAFVAAARGPEGRADADLTAAEAQARHRALGAAADTVPVPLAVPDPQFPDRHERDLVSAPVWDAYVLTELLNRIARPAPPDPRAAGRFFAADLTLLGDGSSPPVAGFLAVREPNPPTERARPAPAVGMVAVHASRLTAGGLPSFVPDLSQPDSVVNRLTDLTLGGGATWFAPSTSEDVLVPPDRGPRGIPVGSIGRRVALAWALQTPSLLSRRAAPVGTLVVAERAVAARLARYAPFAQFGAPWPGVVDGRVVWLAWGYVAAEAYPLGTPVVWRGQRVRYLQAGLIGTVDAETGGVRVYLTADPDPVSQAWQRVLPDIVLSGTALPHGLRQFLRYPEEIFTAQLQVLRTASGRARPAEPYWWAGASVADSVVRLRLRAVDEVYLEPRVAAIIEGIVEDGIARLRVLRYPEPFTLVGPSDLERSFATAAPAGAAVGGRLRIVPFEDGAVAMQAFYADSGTLTGLVAGWRGAIGSGATLRDALRRIGPSAPAGQHAPSAAPFDVAREWFERLDRARASGDWEAFGEAWAGLRAAFGLEPGPAPGRVDTPIPRD